MPELRKPRELELRFNLRPRSIARFNESKDFLLKKVDEQINRIQTESDISSKSYLKLLLKLKESGLKTQEQIKAAIRVIRYLSKSSKNRSIESLMDLKREFVKELESAKLKNDVDKVKLYTREIEIINQELKEYLEEIQISKEISAEDKKLGLMQEPSEKDENFQKKVKSLFAEKYIPYINELAEETRRYYGYNNPDLLFSSTILPKLKDYLDLIIRLNETPNLEQQVRLLKQNSSFYKNSNFLSRVLNKKLFDLEEDLKAKIKARDNLVGKIEIPEKIDLRTGTSILNTLKGFVLSGKEVFLSELENINSRIRFSLVKESIFRTFFSPSNFPNVNEFGNSQIRLKQMIDFLEMFSIFELKDVGKDNYDSILNSYKKKYKELLRIKQKTQKERVGVFNYLFGDFDAQRFNSETYVDDIQTEFSEYKLKKEDVVDIMILLVKGAKLMSSRKATGKSYFRSEDFLSNAVNGIMAYYGKENESDARRRVNNVLRILSSYDILRENPKGTLSVNSTRSFKSKSLRRFVDFVLSLQREKFGI